MAEDMQNDSGASTKKSPKLWVAVRIFAVIDLLVLAFISLGMLNMLTGASNMAPYALVILMYLAIMVGCILLISRKKLAGILLVLIGTAIAVPFSVSSGVLVAFSTEDTLLIAMLLTIIPSAILLILAAFAKK